MVFLFDLGLCLLLIHAAWNAAAGRNDFGAVIFFIVYGLILSLAWVRLDAPNVALAEAAIGAGLTGVLLLGMLARLSSPSDREPEPLGKGAKLTACGLSALVSAGLAAAVLAPGTGRRGLGPAVAEALPAAEVENTVTAVLLVFRGYDTVLEMAVLLAALTGLWSLTPDAAWGGVPGLPQRVRRDGILARFGRLLPAPAIVLAVYLWWVGTDAPGGAFQAGTILAAVAVLIVMAGLYDPPPISGIPVRLSVVLGLGVFVAIGLAGLASGGRFLGYPTGLVKPLLLGLEAALTVSIAATLALMVAGMPERSR